MDMPSGEATVAALRTPVCTLPVTFDAMVSLSTTQSSTMILSPESRPLTRVTPSIASLLVPASTVLLVNESTFASPPGSLVNGSAVSTKAQ
jgi:hypothetical protein